MHKCINFLADILSCAYLSQSTSEPLHKQVRVYKSSSQVAQDVESVALASNLSVTEETLALIQQATNADPTMAQLQNVIRKGWPHRKTHFDKSLCDYFPFWDELSLQDGLISKGECLVICTYIKRQLYASQLLAKNDQAAHQFHISV